MLKNMIKKTPFYSLIIKYRQIKARGDLKKVFKDHIYSYSEIHDEILQYQQKHNLKVFIETGTYAGNTIIAVKDSFEKIYSIELNNFIYKLAKQKFKSFPHIQILNGESDDVLRSLLPNINNRALFWLDAHYSSGATSKGKKHTPIFEELDAIFTHKIKNHIILIDDMKDFIGTNDYPTIEELTAYILENSDYSIEIHSGVAHLTNKVSNDL